MKILELFAGFRSLGKVAEKLGHTVFSVDWENYDGINLQADIGTLSLSLIFLLFLIGYGLLLIALAIL